LTGTHRFQFKELETEYGKCYQLDNTAIDARIDVLMPNPDFNMLHIAISGFSMNAGQYKDSPGTIPGLYMNEDDLRDLITVLSYALLKVEEPRKVKPNEL
jgi:hypothetical protein